MILTLAVMAAMAATPCEGLKSVSLPNTTITTAEFVPEGPQQTGGGGGARGGARGGDRGGAPAPAAPAPDGARGGRGGRGGGPANILPAHCRVVAVLKPTPDS